MYTTDSKDSNSDENKMLEFVKEGTYSIEVNYVTKDNNEVLTRVYFPFDYEVSYKLTPVNERNLINKQYLHASVIFSLYSSYSIGCILVNIILWANFGSNSNRQLLTVIKIRCYC